MSEKHLFRRRDFVLGATAGSVALALRNTSSWAEMPCSFAANPGLSRALVKRMVATPEGTYSTYPHSNGFLPDGRLVIATSPNPPMVTYLAVDLTSGASTPEKIAEVRGARPYYAISQNALMAVPTLFGVKVLDLRQGGRAILDFQDESYLSDRVRFAKTLRYSGDIDISADGTRVATTRGLYDRKGVATSSVVVIDVAGGSKTTIFESALDPATGKVPPLDHAHFSPYDNHWICFCDAAPRAKRRMWTWHPSQANPARVLFDQSAAARPLILTHERALFDRPAMLVVAAGASFGIPRGLYEVSLANGEARLVSDSNRDLHCNASKDGTWFAVSLQGPADLEDHPGRLDLCARPGGTVEPAWLGSTKGYGYSDVVIVNPMNGGRVFLFRGANANTGQPYEVQPVISPDGRWVVVKDARRRNVIGLEIDRAALARFLKI